MDKLEYLRNWRAAHRDQQKEYYQRYRNDNKKKCKEIHDKYYNNKKYWSLTGSETRADNIDLRNGTLL